MEELSDLGATCSESGGTDAGRALDLRGIRSFIHPRDTRLVGGTAFESINDCPSLNIMLSDATVSDPLAAAVRKT